jgi:hypothetical protein
MVTTTRRGCRQNGYRRLSQASVVTDTLSAYGTSDTIEGHSSCTKGTRVTAPEIGLQEESVGGSFGPQDFSLLR